MCVSIIIFPLFILRYFNDLYLALYDTFSPSFLHELLLNNLNDIHGKPKCVRVCSRVLCVYLGGLSSTINIPLVIYFVYGSTANF